MAIETYANNVSTTLSAAITDTTGTSISVTSATGFPSSGNYRILIESEYLLVTGGQGTTTWTVTRGAESSTAATHANSTTVDHILTAGALDQIRKDIAQQANRTSLPASAKQGILVFPNVADGYKIYRDSGSALQPLGPLFALTDPIAASGLTWVNQQVGTTVTDEVGCMAFVVAPQASQQVQALVKTAPAAPYTLTVLVSLLCQLSQAPAASAGLCLRNSVSGKLITHSYQQGQPPRVMAEQWTDAATNNFRPKNDPCYILGSWAWLRIRDDNTNRYFGFSNDGIHWCEWYSEVRTNWITPDQIGVCVNPCASSTGPHSAYFHHMSGF